DLSQAAMNGLLARTAQWIRVKQLKDGGEKRESVFPPKDVAADCLAHPEKTLPPLDAVIYCPIFGSDGSLIATKGYHRGARVWYTGDLVLPPLSSLPTREELAAARRLLLQVFVDFRFVDFADMAHAIGALVLPFVRRLIPGPT